MSQRDAIAESLRIDAAAFPTRVAELSAVGARAADRIEQASAPEAFEGPEDVPAFETLSAVERDLVWRLWVLADAPFGLALAGPAFQDTPTIYVNRTFRALTGYSLATVRGENLRLLQGPATRPEPVADLAEAIGIWEPVTVELLNYRRDGSAFRNRVSLLPFEGPSGAIANWVGMQEAVGRRC
ncbi:PAS domain-containing protein [Natronomonas sp. LN261]|uniref:PAS domain-containing protein n=1 Tax=Natronomonas sp. LN261 TaxID=2750669 RepID=UPI0015EF8987|nr:PAS domain-containing protein [Natronomonas sp. LN261]